MTKYTNIRAAFYALFTTSFLVAAIPSAMTIPLA